MKQKDILLLSVIVVSTGIVSLVISNLFISSPKNRSTAVEVVDVITPEFKSPDKKYFNENSIDPTKNISIGDNLNSDPFN